VITDLPVIPVALAVQQVAKEKGKAVMITAAAVLEFTSKLCSPISSQWTDDTHAMAAASGQVLTGMGGTSWFFITVDFSFGHALQAEATQVIEQAGGKVQGTAKFPIGHNDLSSQLLQAQTSGAKVVGLVAVGDDQVNLIKQAAEFGMATNGKQVMASFLVYITDIHALGLSTAQGLSFGSCFYWDANAGTRAFAKRFLAERGAVPTKNQASIYSATLHYLKAIAKAGTRDAGRGSGEPGDAGDAGGLVRQDRDAPPGWPAAGAGHDLSREGPGRQQGSVRLLPGHRPHRSGPGVPAAIPGLRDKLSLSASRRSDGAAFTGGFGRRPGRNVKLDRTAFVPFGYPLVGKPRGVVQFQVADRNLRAGLRRQP